MTFPFTDDDLKRLKEGKDIWPTVQEFGADDSTMVVPLPLMSALLARLEAAEDHVAYHKCVESVMKCPKAEAHRKASGRI